MAIGRVSIFEEQPDGRLEWREPVAPHPELAEHYAKNHRGMFEIPARLAFRALVTANFVYTNSNIWSLSRIQGLQLRLRALEQRPDWTEGLHPAIHRKLREHLRRSAEKGHWATTTRLAWDLLRYARPKTPRRTDEPARTG
jgi:hypothetical protein